MHRTTILLPKDLQRRAARRARELGLSLGALVRRLLEEALRRPGSESGPDALLADDVVFDGPAPQDASEHHDEHLYGRAP